MASRAGVALRRTGVCVVGALIGTLVAACQEYHTPAPPFRDAASATPDDLRKYCNDPALTFDATAARDTTLPPDDTHVTLLPEKGSAGLTDGALAEGRIIALITVTKGAFPELGANGPGSVCWFVQGKLPNRLDSKFIPQRNSKDSVLWLGTRTHPETPPHKRAEVKWKSPADTLAQRSGLPVHLASLVPAPPPGMRALAWSTCTGGYCCSPSNSHQ
jgi:hypothetical protein